MLRLWREKFVAVVLPDVCRLYSARGKELATCLRDSTSAVKMTDELDSLLEAHGQRGRASLELIVSDSMARLISLPWQESLKNGEQHEAYARACFDHAGFDLDGEWLVRAAYRHFRGTGLGYALPRSLVVGVRHHLLKRQVHLRSIMPMSAHAYWRNASGRRAKRTVLLLRERSRLSALLFDGKKCAGFHVQPMGTGLPDAGRRLLNTVEAVFPSVARVQFWALGESKTEAEYIKDQLPVPGIEVLSGLEWI